jgi:hypothetical protein
MAVSLLLSSFNVTASLSFLLALGEMKSAKNPSKSMTESIRLLNGCLVPLLGLLPYIYLVYSM